MTTFLIIGIVGLVLLAVSLAIGDLFEGLLSGLEALSGDVFSSAVIGAFVSAFGFGGAIAQGLGAPMLITLPAGVVGGVVFGWFALWLTRLVRDGGSDSTPTAEDAIGRGGTVLTAIPQDGFGVVQVLLGGHTVRLNAKADAPIEPGAEVHVTSVLSPTAVAVAPVWPADRTLPPL